MAKKTAPQTGTSDMPTTTNDAEMQRKEFVNPTEAEEDAVYDRVVRARLQLLEKLPFFGYLLLRLRPRLAKKEDYYFTPTASVTRLGTLTVNHEFVKDLSDAQFAGLLCHEVLHPALNCFQRQQGRSATYMTPSGPISVWNVAHDHCINLIIDEMINVGGSPNRRIELPPNPAMDKRFTGMAAEEVYSILIEEAKQNNSYHRMPSTGADVQNDEPTTSPGQGDQDESDGNNPGNQEGGGEGERSISDRQRQADEDWKSALVAAARKQEKTRGNLPLSLQKLVNELVDPKVPWSEVLSQWLGEYGRMQDFSYRKLSRRSEVLGQILPGIVKYGIDEVCVLWDTSGSMNGQETEILSEVQGILDDMSFSLRIIVCDCRVHSDVKEIKDAIEAIPHIKGGGGSDFNPAFDILRDEDYTGVVVAFTDGYIGVPQEKPLTVREVLWVLKEGEPDPTQGRWGMVLRIKDGSGYME
jgi:predicted metal-dependent peptidase